MHAVEIADVSSFVNVVGVRAEVASRDDSRFNRPQIAEFTDDTSDFHLKYAEFHRWYEQNGSLRQRPLDLDELIAELQALYGYDYEEAECTAIFDSRARSGDSELWDARLRQQEVAAFEMSMPSLSTPMTSPH
ncbi:hypothetical protein [Eleftheria terrae]|uniref:hypothetical protein n=1 Tax=Eleftheria terrae TaxID=1597781 RepID=UPI00263A5EEB|nr:hypothetical protein [Eleftheria terrae]WKB50522.1 hypothetical protein N7L95_00300 [Eleftheria terrae]